MWSRIGLSAAWLVATVVSIVIVGQAVGGVRDQVTDRPTALPDVLLAVYVDQAIAGDAAALSEAAPLVDSSVVATTIVGTNPGPGQTGTPNGGGVAPSDTVTSIAPSGSISPQPSASTSPVTSPPDPKEGGVPRTTVTAPLVIITTTAAPPPPTTTVATTSIAAVAPSFETYELVGGWVRLITYPGQVFVDGAGANPGFVVELDESGPDEVKVEFRG
jgi:hypothetical protein